MFAFRYVQAQSSGLDCYLASALGVNAIGYVLDQGPRGLKLWLPESMALSFFPCTSGMCSTQNEG